MTTRTFHTITLTLALLTLSACASGSKTPALTCPQVAVVRALERVDDYGRDTPDASTLVAAAMMDDVAVSRCSYRGDEVAIDFELLMRAEKTDRLGGTRASFPFFVTVLDAQDKVISKKMMTATFAFEKGARRAALAEPLHVTLPHEEKQAKEGKSSPLRVLLGFQLSEAQLAAREQVSGAKK